MESTESGVEQTVTPGAGPTRIAARVAEIVADVLGDPTAPGDHPFREHFQDLGGSSLQAIRICARVRKELGLAAAPEDLFESDSVDAFCAALAHATDRG